MSSSRFTLASLLSVSIMVAISSKAFAVYTAGYLSARFYPGIVSYPQGVASCATASITTTPSALEDSLLAVQVDSLITIGDYWRASSNIPGVLSFADVYILKLHSGASTLSALARIKSLNGVAAADSLSEGMLFSFPDDPPNDPYFPKQWHLENTGQFVFDVPPVYPGKGLPDVDIDARGAWSLSLGPNVSVMVIDTGIYGHADLNSPIQTNCDPDILYYGVTTHGTKVAGLIAAKCNNNQYVSGVNCHSNATLVNVKATQGVFGDTPLESRVICGLNYAATNGIKIANLSIGYAAPSFLLGAAVKNAYLSGTLIVAAAGNRFPTADFNPEVWPAAYKKTTMAVAAVQHGGREWEGGCWHDYIDVAGPGGDPKICTLTYNYSASISLVDTSFGGTSAATPIVAGVASRLPGQVSSLTNRDLEKVLVRTAYDLPPAGKDEHTGNGLVSAYRAARFLDQSQRTFVQGVVPASVVTTQSVSQLYTKTFVNLGWNYANPSLPDVPTVFLVKRHKMVGTATMPSPYLSNWRNCWVRHSNGNNPGWEDLPTLDAVEQVGWGEVDSSATTSTSASFYSYTYETYRTSDTTFVGFFPIHPDSASIPYSAVLGSFDTAPAVKVISPNGGEHWLAGTRTIKWSAYDDDGVDSTSAFWSLDQGFTWPYTLTTGTSGSDSTWSWVLAAEDTASTLSRIGIVMYDGRDDGMYDMSDQNFHAIGITGQQGDPPGTLLNAFAEAVGDDESSESVHAVIEMDGKQSKGFVFSFSNAHIVCLQLFDVRGRKICDLWDGAVGPGLSRVDWDLKDSFGEEVSSGVYFYRATIDGRANPPGKILVIR